MSDDRIHYHKVIRDAAAPLDSLIHRLASEGLAFALARTVFKLTDVDVQVVPDPKDRDAVFEIATEEFSKAGWGFGATTAPPEEDPARPVVAIRFRHPRTETQMGYGPRPPKGQAIGFSIPTPPVGVEMTVERVEWYAKQAADITRALLAQRAVDETGGIPGHPVLVPKRVAATPLHTSPLLTASENEDD